MRAILSIAMLLASSVLFVSPVHADELADFAEAQRAYERGDYATALTLFEAMVGGAAPAIRNEVLITESRKYLAAAYLFEGRESDAEAQFARLIEGNPEYILDPVAFPAAVHASFSAVKERVNRERAERTSAQEAAERERRERAVRQLLEQEQRIAQLRLLAEEVTVEETNSRWIAMLPFGTGQFQNGHRSAGLAIMSTQIFLATTSLSTFIYHRFLLERANEMLVDKEPVDDRLKGLERGVRITNQISTALLGAVAIGGIIDAQIRFREGRSTTRRRELSDELQDLQAVEDPEAASLRLDVGLGSAQLTLSF